MKSLVQHMNEHFESVNESKRYEITAAMIEALAADTTKIKLDLKIKKYAKKVGIAFTNDEVQDLVAQYKDIVGDVKGINESVDVDVMFNTIKDDPKNSIEIRIKDFSDANEVDLSEEEISDYADLYRSTFNVQEGFVETFDISKVSSNDKVSMLAVLDAEGIKYNSDKKEISFDISSLSTDGRKEVLAVLENCEETNESKTEFTGANADIDLVKKAISYIKGNVDPKDILQIHDESKGYVYTVKGKSGWHDITYAEINDVLNRHSEQIKTGKF